MVSPPSSDSSDDDGTSDGNSYRLLDVVSAEAGEDSLSATRRCYCSRNLAVQTLWNPADAGRRFIECPRMRAHSCNYFEWLDPEFPNRAKEVIWELYEQKSELLDVTTQLSTDLADAMDGLERMEAEFEDEKGLTELLSHSDATHRQQLEISLAVNKRLRKWLTYYVGFTVAVAALLAALAATFK